MADRTASAYVSELTGISETRLVLSNDVERAASILEEYGGLNALTETERRIALNRFLEIARRSKRGRMLPRGDGMQRRLDRALLGALLSMERLPENVRSDASAEMLAACNCRPIPPRRR